MLKTNHKSFYVLSFLALVLISGLYVEEAFNYYSHKQISSVFLLSSPDCRPVTGFSDRSWCKIPGYGWTKFQRGADAYIYIDPSSPELSEAEVSEIKRTYEIMFRPEPVSQQKKP